MRKQQGLPPLLRPSQQALPRPIFDIHVWMIVASANPFTASPSLSDRGFSLCSLRVFPPI
eukprot:m.106596 g.106596  ORF g.106596 m.106596 type:complete len:60 (+) comp51679_c0_seq5:302-481(+)